MDFESRLCHKLCFSLPHSALLVLVLIGLTPAPSLAQANVRGQWQVLSYQMPINPVHLALLPNGKVLAVAGSGNSTTNTDFESALWDPVAGSITTQPVAWDMFCEGMISLSNGQVLIAGGTLHYSPFLGLPNAGLYDPASNTFSNLANMADGRWYPTLTELSDGTVMVFSGDSSTGPTNNTVEIYNPTTGWGTPYVSPWTPPLYPRLHLLPNGNVFYSGSSAAARYFYPATHTWSAVIATTNLGSERIYGSSVLLPLTPANNYDPRVMILGGGDAATATTEIIDLGAAKPAWQWGPSMSQPRVEMDALLLPTGQILALNGSATNEDVTTASLNADLLDPNTLTVKSAGQETYARLYHSGALLLPNATVAVLGGNPHQGSVEEHIEIYSPAYLFNPDGSAATPPVIASAPTMISYAGAFQVQSPDAAKIASVVLIPPGTPTHAFDNSARLVGLSFTTGAGVLHVTGPPTSSIAPPGTYMMFLVNNAGVPSTAAFVNLAQVGSGINFIGATSNARIQATSIALQVPSGVHANHVMVAQVTARRDANPSMTITAPSGWTLVRSDSSPVGLRAQAIYVRVAGASEPSSYTWNSSQPASLAGGIVAYANVNTTTPIDGSSGQYSATSATSANAPSVTTTHETDLLLAFFAAFQTEGTSNRTLPSGMTRRWVASSNAHDDAASADQTLLTAGPSGTRMASFPTAAPSIGALIALAPASG
jgi:hypothetical protein